METFDIRHAKAHLSRLIDSAAAGEPFVIASAGRPLVKAAPLDEAPAPRPIGFLKGQIRVPEDFDRMGEKEIGEMFGVS